MIIAVTVGVFLALSVIWNVSIYLATAYDEGYGPFKMAGMGILGLIMGLQIGIIIPSLFFIFIFAIFCDTQNHTEDVIVNQLYIEDDEVFYYEKDSTGTIKHEIDDYVLINNNDSTNVVVNEYSTLVDTAYWDTEWKVLENVVIKLGVGQKLEEIK